MFYFSTIMSLISLLSINVYAQNKQQIFKSKNATTQTTLKDKKIVATNPNISFGNFTGTNVEVEDFKKNFLITLDSNYVIKHMDLFFAGNGFPNTIKVQVQIAVKNIIPLSSLFVKCTKGSIIAFDNITLKGFGKIVSVPGKKFILY